MNRRRFFAVVVGALAWAQTKHLAWAFPEHRPLGGAITKDVFTRVMAMYDSGIPGPHIIVCSMSVKRAYEGLLRDDHAR